MILQHYFIIYFEKNPFIILIIIFIIRINPVRIKAAAKVAMHPDLRLANFYDDDKANVQQRIKIERVTIIKTICVRVPGLEFFLKDKDDNKLITNPDKNPNRWALMSVWTPVPNSPRSPSPPAIVIITFRILILPLPINSKPTIKPIMPKTDVDAPMELWPVW